MDNIALSDEAIRYNLRLQRKWDLLRDVTDHPEPITKCKQLKTNIKDRWVCFRIWCYVFYTDGNFVS